MLVIFYGPTGGKGNSNLGGGETGNRRTIALLRSMGFNVRIMEKPLLKGRGIFTFTRYATLMLAKIIQTAFVAAVSGGSKSIHIAGFYGMLIYPEFLLCFLGRLIGVRVVYEIRAGGAIDAFEQRSSIYRWVFLKSLSSSQFVLAQGKEYQLFFGALTKSPILYYPNYIANQDLPACEMPQRNTEHLELVYFGRLSPTKNIEAILDGVQLLKSQKLPAHCSLIGGGDSEYLEYLQNKARELKVEDYVDFLPTKTTCELRSILSRYHIFLFPTKEPREGHSNALTEAMSFGIVPVATRHGFNASVIDCEELILPEASGLAIANVVSSIWADNRWQSLSKRMWDRVRLNYTENNVISVLSEAYEIIPAHGPRTGISQNSTTEA